LQIVAQVKASGPACLSGLHIFLLILKQATIAVEKRNKGRTAAYDHPATPCNEVPSHRFIKKKEKKGTFSL